MIDRIDLRARVKRFDFAALRKRSWFWPMAFGVGTGLVLLVLFFIKTERGFRYMYFVPTLQITFLGFVAGVALGAVLIFFKALLGRWGKWIFLGIAAFVIVGSDLMIREQWLVPFTSGIGGFAGFWLGLGAVLAMAAATVKHTPGTVIPNYLGSSHWASRVELAKWGLLKAQDDHKGLFLGTEKSTGEPIVYDGDMHALTVAPTRTGKGASAIIPNLLRSDSSIIVIDPKGENARRSVQARLDLGQQVYVIDPWGISTHPDQYGAGIDKKHLCGFDPLASLDPDDPDLVTDAMLLAEALVVQETSEPFWSNEARAMIHGIILHVVTADEEAGRRNLARVREILSLPIENPDGGSQEGTLKGLFWTMQSNPNLVVCQAGSRMQQKLKSEKEFVSVLSTAQSSTHFLDSPKILESLSSDSSLRFADLKTAEQRITVYLVLPLDRLQTFHRWLRLLVTAAIVDLTRVPPDPKKPPVRIILDEFAALGTLDLISTAFGTMAGLGVQLWVLTQDLAQLMKLYGDKTWQTFVSNAGVFQYFGSRDYETAKYASHLCGKCTMQKSSFAFGSTKGISRGSSSSYSPGGGGGSSSSSSSYGTSETFTHSDYERELAYPDQLMTLRRDLQVLFVENRFPIIAKKRYWFDAIKAQPKAATVKAAPEFKPDDTQPIGVAESS